MEGTMTDTSEGSGSPDRDAVRLALGLAPVGEFDAIVDEEGDGRTLRRTRNRQRVIVALLDLLRSGNMDPSVADIADLAGVSHRSVFRYFDDINDLVRTAIDYEVQQAIPLAEISDLGLGSLDRRIDSWVDSRLRIYLATFEVSCVARLKAVEIPSINEGMKGIYQLAVTRMRNHFANELDELGADGGFVIDAAMSLTSFESFHLQRVTMDHSTERIRQVWMRALTTLFQSHSSSY